MTIVIASALLFVCVKEKEAMDAARSGKRLRKMWKNEDMVVAMEAVEDKKLSVAGAAVKFKLPRKTLKDRIKSRMKHGTSPGP